MQPSLSPMHGRRRRPSAILRGSSGSAISARVIATRSTPREARLGHLRLDVSTGDEHRRAHLAAEADRALVVDALGQVVGRDEVAGREPRCTSAAADAEEVDRAGGREPAGDLDQLVRAEAPGHALVERHAEADEKRVRHGLAHRLKDLPGEASAVLEAAAVVVRPGVHARVEELLDQMTAERGDLAAVQAAAFEPPRRVGEPLDDRGQLVAAKRDRHLEVHVLGEIGRRAEWDPGLGGRASPPHVGELRDAERAVAADPVRERPQGGLVALVPEGDRAVGRLRGRVDRGRPERHHEGAAAGGLAHVVVDLGGGDQPVAAPPGGVRRRDDPVPQAPPAELER